MLMIGSANPIFQDIERGLTGMNQSVHARNFLTNSNQILRGWCTTDTPLVLYY
jgi:hypothetical protein